GFSRYTLGGCGEGFPHWALSKSITPSTPLNTKDCSGWGLKLFTDGDMKKCFDDFYADTDQVRSRFITMLSLVSTRLADHPAVIGYDILNEPVGDEKTQLAPLYEDGEKALRAR